MQVLNRYLSGKALLLLSLWMVGLFLIYAGIFIWNILQPAHIVDPRLRGSIYTEVIQDEHGTRTYDGVYAWELLFLHELSDSGHGITDLSGMEHCAFLVELRLSSNKISDLSPLSGLKNLKHLPRHE